MSETFEMVKPAAAVRWFFPVVGVVILLTMLPMVLGSLEPGQHWGIVIPLAYGLGGAAMMTWLARSIPAHFEVSPQGLRIVNNLYGRPVAASSLKVAEAAIVTDLKKHPSLRPKWRIGGTGMPGYSAGWFQLKDGQKALLFVTRGREVVMVPTTDHYVIFLEVQEPQRFVEALQRLAHATS